jgi:hypothetical protein
LEGTQEGRSVVLFSIGRADLTVSAATSGPPFSAPTSVVLPGGGQVNVDVVFTAGTTLANGTLQLSAHGQTVSIPLTGQGVKALVCTPSGVCRVSRFDLASGTCVESIAPDGAECIPASVCLDHGQCESGQCVGSPRNCDDGNKCTVDECAESAGCIHTPVSCPQPSNPCQQPTCDPGGGCGSGAAPDWTPCGSIDCVNAHLCVAGGCTTLPTPDGVTCAPPTPCRGAGHCHSQQCQVPDAGDLVPVFALPLTRAPSPTPGVASVLLAHRKNLFWAACDGGCALESYTFNGFQRFEQPFPDARPRWMAGFTDAGVVIAAADGLEAYDEGRGALLWAWPADNLPPPLEIPGFSPRTDPARAVVQPDGTVVAAFTWFPGLSDPDGGVADAGPPLDAGPWPGLQTLVSLSAGVGLIQVQDLRGLGTASILAGSAPGALYLFDGSGVLARADAIDAGWSVTGLGSWPGPLLLAASGGALAVGATWLVAPDGGALGSLLPLDGGVPFYPDGRNVVAADGVAFALSRSCQPPLTDPCADIDKTTFLRAVDVASGLQLWSSQAAPSGFPVQFDETAVISGGAGVTTLLETDLGFGNEAWVQLYGGGSRIFTCRIPPPGALAGGAFDNGQVYVLINRLGAWWLEAYDLSPLVFETSGWPQRNGTAGGRQEQ